MLKLSNTIKTSTEDSFWEPATPHRVGTSLCEKSLRVNSVSMTCLENRLDALYTNEIIKTRNKPRIFVEGKTHDVLCEWLR